MDKNTEKPDNVISLAESAYVRAGLECMVAFGWTPEEFHAAFIAECDKISVERKRPSRDKIWPETKQ